MNNNKGFTFEKARALLKTLIFGAGILCVVGLILSKNMGEEYAGYAVVAAGACIAIGLFVLFTCIKCPFCGKRIIRNCLVVTRCPHCSRDLTTGLKSKKKK